MSIPPINRKSEAIVISVRKCLYSKSPMCHVATIDRGKIKIDARNVNREPLSVKDMMYEIRYIDRSATQTNGIGVMSEQRCVETALSRKQEIAERMK